MFFILKTSIVKITNKQGPSTTSLNFIESIVLTSAYNDFNVMSLFSQSYNISQFETFVNKTSFDSTNMQQKPNAIGYSYFRGHSFLIS